MQLLLILTCGAVMLCFVGKAWLCRNGYEVNTLPGVTAREANKAETESVSRSKAITAKHPAINLFRHQLAGLVKLQPK